MKKYIHPEPFQLESDAIINNLEIAYHTYGQINEKKDNVVWVCHALSGTSDVMSWWSGLFGEDCLYNPDDYFIICANTIGSPYGSTCPKDLDFPAFTPRDVVKAHFSLAKSLGINEIHTLIGGSFGGYQALEFAYSFKGDIQHLILLACSAKESAWGIAVHEAQRIALKADTSFGTPGGGEAGMKTARSIAMLTYRTSQEFVENQTDNDQTLDDFKASSYLHYHGDKFVKRFDALSYYYLTKCIDTHNLGRNRGGIANALKRINIPTLVFGITSDTLVPINFQRKLGEHIPNVVFHEIDSLYGHDGFLKETARIVPAIRDFYNQNKFNRDTEGQRLVLKFGGSSLYGQEKLENVYSIIDKASQDDSLAIIVSARGKSTDLLIDCFNQAKTGADFKPSLAKFIQHQKDDLISLDISKELADLEQILTAIQMLREDNEFAYDSVVAFGELISAKSIVHFLNGRGLKAEFIDARTIIHTEKVLDNFKVNMEKSRIATRRTIAALPNDTIAIITGFIATSEQGRTVTLGRNGSNYSATLVANFIQAKAVQNWTDVPGVFSANPSVVPNAIPIKAMTYKEANEMANFGVNLLHPKTILPLMETKIPLVIKSTLTPNEEGTLINHKGGYQGVKAVTMMEGLALVTIEGTELSEKIGIDARIFTALKKKDISVNMIAQASSERSIGFVIRQEDITNAEIVLNAEFDDEIRKNEISSIGVNDDIGVISIIGRHNYALEKAILALRRNKVWMHLISNSINGEHISLVINRDQLKKATRLVHNEVYGAIKTVHVFGIGKGQVGGQVIQQIIETSSDLIKSRNLDVKIIGLADSKKYVIDAEGLQEDWRERLADGKDFTDVDKLIKDLKQLEVENIVLVDNTSSTIIADSYLKFLKANFDIVASNKKANSSDLAYYKDIKKTLLGRGRYFYYEANVGAGLPIIDYLKSLYQSSDVVTDIRGVFSGSLSYIFNNFSKEDLPFSEQLMRAKSSGFTEPDPREDLNGMDVARKLVILAREVNFPAKIEMVEIQNLIPESLRGLDSFDEFIKHKDELDAYYKQIKDELAPDEVLRYVGVFNAKTEELSVELRKVSTETPLGQIKNADSLFEIYTESYGEQPIVIQGAGAGPTVTARAVYSDVLRLGRAL